MLRITAAILLICGLWDVTIAQTQSVEETVRRARQAGVDAGLVEQVGDRALSAGHGPAELNRLISPALSLAERDLPSRPVLQKVLEGLAKNVPSARIGAVVDTYSSHIAEAGQFTQQWFSRRDVARLIAQNLAQGSSTASRHEMIESVAQALSQGVPDRTIATFLDRLPSEARRVPVQPVEVATLIRLMPDLPDITGQPDVTAELLIRVLDARFSRSDLRQLPTALRLAQHRTDLPADAVARGAPLSK